MTPYNQDTDKIIHKIIDNANVYLLYLNSLGNIVLCNKNIEEFIGKKRKDILGIYWLKALYGDDGNLIKQQMFLAMMDDSIKYKRSNDFEDVITGRDKKEKHFLWSISPILGDRNELEGVLLIGYDRTELIRREAAFKKIDDTLKNILSSIKEYALYVVNLDGNITYFGMGSELMFGWDKNKIVFKHVSLLHAADDITGKLPLILEQVRKSGQYETEIDLIKKDGQLFPVILTVSQFLDSDGNQMGYIFIAKDITEKKKLEYQIFQSEKLAAIGQLAAGMGHEINNPLFVISGKVDLLLSRKRISQSLKKELNSISEQAERIRKLVERLLRFARKTPPKLETLDVNEIIESVLPLVSYHKIQRGKISIEKHFGKDLPPVRGDLNQLQEVFVNLFINAMQSMSESGTLSITTSNFQNLFAQINISDTGSGISQDNLKNLFMPFFSTKKEGTGLGLSICYNIVKNHNGSIDVESQPGKGTTFIIKLPFV
ncbi:MAG: PAS domain-containing protein [Candidatus Omnitrophica bacterium]|nr:PAS domain-containing protein [Candidatus Omnitrophota bacterium]